MAAQGTVCAGAPVRIYIGNQEQYEAKRRRIVAAGVEKLHVVSDFDSTLTCPQALTSYAIIERSSVMTQAYRDAAFELYEKYHAIEVNHAMTVKEKTPFMVEWWDKAHELLMQQGLTREKVKQMVDDAWANIALRGGADDVLRELEQQRVPVLVFSAGVGNIIDVILSRMQLLTRNVHVVSNFLAFDKTGTCTGFSDKVIHVFNKNETCLKSTPFYTDVADRCNVLLLGDSLGDTGMAQGLPCVENIIKVGFLNRDLPADADDESGDADAGGASTGAAGNRTKKEGGDEERRDAEAERRKRGANKRKRSGGSDDADAGKDDDSTRLRLHDTPKTVFNELLVKYKAAFDVVVVGKTANFDLIRDLVADIVNKKEQ